MCCDYNSPIRPHISDLAGEIVPVFYGFSTRSEEITKVCSCEGRTICLINVVGHIFGTVAKPFVYTLNSIYHLVVGMKLLCDGNVSEACKRGLRFFDAIGCVILTPFAQTALAVRALFAFIFHPGIYFQPSAESGACSVQ